MQRLYHSGRAFLLPKKLEKCRKRAAETSEFCRSLSEYEMYTDEEGKHPLLISCSLNDYPVTSLKSLLKSLTTTIDQYEQPQHPKAQKDAAHINKHAMHIVRLYYTAFDILEKARLSLTETRNARNCWRFATASTCVKTGRTHPNSLSLLMRLKRDFRMT